MANKEQSIKNQIASMEAWAIDAKRKADSGNYKEAEENLNNINSQGRRLEWRGGMHGLRHLPDLAEVKELKTRISSGRAAAQNALTFIHDLIKLLPKKEGKKPEEVAAIEKKEINNRKNAGQNIAILIQVLKQARAISDKEPWLDVFVIAKNKKILETFLRGERYYKNYTLEQRRDWWRGIDAWVFEKWIPKLNYQRVFEDINLEGADLRGFNFKKVHFASANLSKAKLQGAYFELTQFLWTNLSEANLTGARFLGAHFYERTKLKGAVLKETIFLHATFTNDVDLTGADLEGANFENVSGLTAEQLRSTKNWEKAKNISPALLGELGRKAA